MTIWLLLVCLIIAPPISFAQTVLDNESDLERINIVEHLGDTIPMNLTFTDDQGREVQLERYFKEDRPVLLVMAYYTCPKLCNLVMNGTSDAVRELEWLPGEEFRMVTVSIDPRETELVAAAKKKNYLNYIGKEGVNSDAWRFLTGEGDQSRALADALGFNYFYDEKREEYAHPAALFVLTGDGVISRYFYGIKFDPGQLKLSLLEASKGRIGDTFDRILLYCFHYDPESKGYVLFAKNVMKLGGAITLVLLILIIGGLWLKEMAKRRVSKNNLWDGKKTAENSN